jgi:ribokinase
MSVSVDPSSWALIRARAFPPVDLLLPNEREAEVLAGVDGDPEAAARALAGADTGSPAREVVVKLGPAGALWSDGAGVVRVPATPADVVDTTGAGDAFAAGLLVARLRGQGPRAALEAACAVAARAVAQVGARPERE